MADVTKKIGLDVSVKGAETIKETRSAIDALLESVKAVKDAQRTFSTRAVASRIKDATDAIRAQNRSLNAQARAYERIAAARSKLGEIKAKAINSVSSRAKPQSKGVEEKTTITTEIVSKKSEKIDSRDKIIELLQKIYEKIGETKKEKVSPTKATVDTKVSAQTEAKQKKSKSAEQEIPSQEFLDYSQKATEANQRKIYEYQSRAKAIRSIQPTDIHGLLSELVPTNIFENLSQQYANKSFESQKRIAEFEKQYKSLKGKTDEKSLAKQKELRESIRNEQVSAMQSEKKSGNLAAAKVILSSVWKTATGLFNTFNQNFKSVMGFSLSIKENFADVMENVRKITDMYSGLATYATGSSLVMNAAARETQMKYGLSASAAYGFDQAKSLLGIQSDTDLMYMNAEQRQLFAGYMEKQQQMYNQLESSGVLRNIQELQLEFKMFKQQLAIDFLNWFAKNRDSLMALFTKLLNVTEWILDKLTGAFTLFGGGDTGFTTTSDRMTTVSNVKSYNINISQSNKVEGVADQNAMESYLKGTIDDLMKQAATAIGEG